jgi:hypothetical protein
MGMSSKEIAHHILEGRKVKIHRNTISNYIRKSKGEQNGNDVSISKE